MKSEDPIVNSAIQKALRAGVSRAKGSCPDDNRLNAYLENRLSQQEKDRMEGHLADCSLCQEIVSLSISLSAPESEVAEETSPHPRKSILFHLSLPVSALALIVVGVAAGILYFRTPSLREAAQSPQMAESRRSRPVPQAAPETASPASSQDDKLRDKAAMPPTSSEVRAVERKDENTRVAKDLKTTVVVDDKKTRLAEESGRYNTPAPAPPPQPVMKRAETFNEKPADQEKEKLDAFRRKSEQDLSAATSVSGEGGQKVAGKETDKRLQYEGMQQRQQVAAPAVQVQTYGLDGDRQKKSSASPESLLLAFAQQPLEALDKARASGKLENYKNQDASNVANNRVQPARQVGSKTFYLFSDYWIDSRCRDFPKVPVVEVGESEPVFQEILKAMPELSALRSANAPVLIHWQENNYLLRFRSPH